MMIDTHKKKEKEQSKFKQAHTSNIRAAQGACVEQTTNATWSNRIGMT